MTSPPQTSQPPRYRQLEQAEVYDRKASAASGGRRFSHFLELSALRRALKHVKGSSVLDAPCGTGRIDPLLRTKFERVVGLDSSDMMLQVYRSGDSRREGHQGDIFNLPFVPASFEWVVCHRLFHHFGGDDRRAALLKSIAAVATRGVVFYAWVKTALSRRHSSRRHTVTRDQLMKLIAGAGLTFESIHYAAWPFQPKAIVVCRKM